MKVYLQSTNPALWTTVQVLGSRNPDNSRELAADADDAEVDTALVGGTEAAAGREIAETGAEAGTVGVTEGILVERMTVENEVKMGAAVDAGMKTLDVGKGTVADGYTDPHHAVGGTSMDEGARKEDMDSNQTQEVAEAYRCKATDVLPYASDPHLVGIR